MKPIFRMLDDDLRQRIVNEAQTVLHEVGVDIGDPDTQDLLTSSGAGVRDDGRVTIPPAMVEKARETVPSSFSLFDIFGEQTHCFDGTRTHFTPGSAAINILDRDSGEIRPAATSDLVKLAKVVSGLEHMNAQSTALVSSDVPEAISDSYRLYINLLHCEKSVVTGAFTEDGFSVIRDLLLAVRGTKEKLASHPLAILTCCPTAPLRWTQEGAQNLMDCARMRIPVEIIPVPLTGFMAPVSLVGTLVQHTAEILSGVVIAQLVQPGTPLLFGGSPAIFDIRYETTPMGAMETTMLTCGAAEIGKHLGLPTQGYIALSDSKALDAQAGLETSFGTIMAVLTGLDNVSGPGMLDFESCQSLEKLVVDHETCRMAQRLGAGIEPRDDFPSRELFEELLREKHLLIADHTMRYLRDEISFPGAAIDRTSRARWLEDGKPTMADRVASEVDRLIGEFTPSRIAEEVRSDLRDVMAAAAREAGMERLPDLETG